MFKKNITRTNFLVAMFILKLSQSLSILIIVLNLSLILGFAFSISLFLSFSALVVSNFLIDINWELIMKYLYF